jgi:hypothetical protein
MWLHCTVVTDRIMVMDSCKGTVTEGGKLIVYYVCVGSGVMVMDSCTATVTESGK